MEDAPEGFGIPLKKQQGPIATLLSAWSLGPVMNRLRLAQAFNTCRVPTDPSFTSQTSPTRLLTITSCSKGHPV